MKPKKRRVTEVPPSIRSFIDGVTASPLEDIELMLRDFVWEYDKGDFNHWTELFNLFDSYLDKYIGPRKDLSLEDGFLEADMPFPRGPVLQILRISRLISEHCSNRHLVSSFERHLASLLSSADADIVEASLQTLMAFTNKSISKSLSVRTGSLASKLFTLSQGWGGKDGALGLVACSLPDHLPSEAGQLGSTLHFEFYSTNHGSKGLRVIHMPNVDLYRGSDLELLAELIKEHDVPVEMRFALLTRLRFARAFGSLTERCRYVCIRLYAFVMLVHVGRELEDVETLLGNEPEFIDELLSLLNCDEIPEKIRVLAILSLAALCQDRSHTPTAIYSVTSGAHSSVLPGLLQKTIDSITTGSMKCSVIFAEALLSLVLVLVSSTPGSLALQESGLISTILPLLKDTNPQHLLLVTTAVQVVEGLLDYHNPSSAVFRDLGGLDDSILRLKSEISVIESVSVSRTAEQEPSTSQESSRKGKEPETALVQVQAAHSDSLFLHNRRALIKALLRTISLATYVPGATARVGGSEESVLPHCLCAIFKRGKEFGGGVFSLGAHVMMDLIHKDPTCFPALEAAGLPGAFVDVITNGPPCSSDAVTCIPPCLEALCLNGNGLQMVKERNALRCFLRIFTSKSYLKALNGEATGVISNGLDELLRHAPTLRSYGVDAVIWILDSLAKIGSGSGSSSGSGLESPSTAVPMDIDKPVEKDQMGDASITVESFLPGCISNIVRLLEPIVQNSDTCRMFVEKKGVEKVLKLFDLECIPVLLSIGNSISSAFKNFSPTQSVAMLRIVGSFIREQLKSVNGVLSSAVSGSKLDESEPEKQMEVLRSLSGLEGLLVLSSFLLKNNTVMMAELAVAESEILKELAKIYVETTWQLSLLAEIKPDEDLNGSGQEPGTCRDDSIAIVSEREIGEEASTEPAPSTVRSDGISTSSSMEAPLYNWNADEALASMVRSAASMHRNGHRHGRLSSLARLRGGARLTRHLEALHAHSDTEGPVFTLENYISLHTGDNKSPDCHVREVLTRLAAAIRAFLLMVVKSLPGRRRTEPTLNPASRSVLTALSRLFLTALSYSGHSTPGFESSLSVKCCYLGKVSDDMSALTFDSWRRACNTSVVNGFYVTGTFKELLTTFEATSQLLWSFPFSTDGKSPNRPSWLLETLQSYCKLLEYYVNSSFLLSPSAPQSTQLLVQPVATELSINLFPVPRDPEGFVSMLQSQVLEAVLPIWNHPVLPTCPVTILSPLISIMDHIFSGVGEFKHEHGGSGGVNPRLEVGLSIDETTVSTIVEMGFSRARVEEALRHVGSNSVELATDWLFTHPEELVQEDVQLAQALALSLGSNSEPGKEELADRPSAGDDMAGSTVPTPALPLDDVLSVSMKLFKNYGESVALSLGDLLVTLCNRNKGEGRLKVVLYLVHQLKVCPVGPGMDVSLLYPTAHMLALLLAEDGNTREIAAIEGLIPVVLRILNFFWSGPRSNDALAEKAMSTLLLVLGSMLQQTPIKNAETPEEPNSDGMDKSKEKHVDFLCTVLGKPTGYLTDEGSQQALTIACELVKQHVPAVVMQAALQLCARLTKTYSLSTLFLETGGLSSLFNLPSGSIFPGFDSVASVIVRHVIEDPQTLQSAMELEIKHALSGAGTLARNGGRVSPQSFLTSMAPLICRDPSVFMKAAAAVCQVDSSSGGRLNVVLVKDNKEKDKDRHENKSGDASTPGRLSRVHKRVPPSLSQVMDQLLELIISYEPKAQESSDMYFSEASFDDKIVPMEIDEPNPKGKSKVDDMGESERSACMARVSLVLKLLSEMLLMYSHTALVLLKRDSEMSQMRGNCGILYHILHNLLPLTTKDSKDGSDLLAKLSGRATSFLVALCGRSTEGRRRVVSEIVRAFTSLLGGSTGGTSSSTSGPSNGGALVPDKRVWSWCNLVNMILLCNSGSPNSNLSPGCSPDVARAMIDGGMVQSLATVLRALDLDNPHAASICNLILKSLETLTRAANVSEPKSDKNKTGGSDHGSVLSIREPGEVHPAADTGTVVAEDQETERDQQLDGQDFATEDTGICIGMSMDRGDSENPHELARSGLVGEEDVGEDEEEEEEEDEDEEDDDDRDDDMGVAGRGAHLIPLADTNPVDEEEYNDDMIEDDEDDDELIPNRGVIEVRWQGGATGLDQIRLPPEIRVSRGRGFIEIASESFPGDDADDLYNLHPPFGVERRRQPGASAGSNRSTLLSRQRSDFVSGFQHPLVARPPRESTSRDNRLHPVSRWRMFDNGMPPDGSLFSGDRLVGSGASSQLLGFSLGMESLRIGGRRGTGFDGRWTDNGQPPASSQAAAIAQAIEDHFVSQIQVVTPSGSSNPYPSNSNPSQSGDQVETDPLVNVPILPSASPMLDVTLNGGNNAPLSENILVTGEQVDRLMPNELNRDASSDMDSGRSSCHAVIIGTQPVPELSDAHVNSDADASACANSVGIEVPEVSAGANSVEIDASEVNDGYRTPPVPMDSIEGYQTLPVPIDVDVDTNAAAAAAPDDADAEADPPDVNHTENNVDGTNEIDPTFLEALPEDLRAEVLASQQGRQVGGSVGEAETGAGIAGDAADEIDPEFLAALPPDLQAEVLAQQRAQRIAQSHPSSGQPVDMDNASIIATFPPEIREEVLLTSSEAVLSALPSALLAEAQMLRDRELSRYRSRGSLFGGSQHRLGNSGRRFALDNHHHQSVMDRGVGVSLVRRVVPTISSGSRGNSNTKEVEGVPLFDAAALEALIRLFQLAQPLSKGILQRVMLNLCAHSITRRLLIGLIVSMIRPEAGLGGRTDNVGHRRLYGCQCNVVYAQPQSPTGLPPLVLRQLLEILTFLASSHASVANILSCSDLQSSDVVEKDGEEKGKDVNSDVTETPLMLFLKLLNTPLFLRSRLYIELVMSLLEVVVNNAVSKIDFLPESDNPSESGSPSEIQGMEPPGPEAGTERPFRLDEPNPNPSQPTSAKQSEKLYNILVGLPEPDLRNLCTIMSREGLPDKVYTLAAEVIKKLASVAPCHRKFFSSELATVARSLSSSAVSELSVLRSDQNLGLQSSLAGSAILRVLQSLCTLNSDSYQADEKQQQLVLSDLNSSLEPMWQELSECITVTESKLGQTGDLGPASQPLPPGAQRLLPFIESFFVLCEKLQLDTAFQLENISSSPRTGGTVTFARVAEKHRRLLNLFIRQNPSLLEKSLSMMLKVPRLIDFDNKRAYFRSRIRQQHDNLVAGPIRISVRRAYVLEDSYNQLRLRRYQDLKGRLTVQFQGEEGIDAGGLTREWYQLLSRVIFDKGALLFTTVGNNASFQPNPNSVYQTEHLSYFKFVGRVVAKALFDGQLLDVHFTRSFYKHMLGVKVTYHDIEAVDPDYYKNLKWMLENDVNDIPDLTFSMDADEEKHILYEKNQVTDYELKPGGRNIRVTEETKHEYVDLVADHILTNAIRPQINAFLEGFTELIPRELISIFNDKELELLISGLPEIDLNDLKANSEYIGYSAASPVIQWFWEVVKGFNKEDRARLLQFVTGTSKVPLEGFKALQGISGPQRFQIHKAYGAPDRLPSAHTCFNQLDLPEYNSKEQLEERLLLAIHEASEGFGFG